MRSEKRGDQRASSRFATSLMDMLEREEEEMTT